MREYPIADSIKKEVIRMVEQGKNMKEIRQATGLKQNTIFIITKEEMRLRRSIVSYQEAEDPDDEHHSRGLTTSAEDLNHETDKTRKEGKRKMCSILVCAIIKGGTGKSTTAAAIVQRAAAEGQKVLAIDLDPQANLSMFIGADSGRPGAFEMIRGTAAADCIQTTAQGVDIAAAGKSLATITGTSGSGRRLLTALQPVRDDYDLIVIDTPPQIGELTLNGMIAADGLLIPLETNTASIQGLNQIAEIAKQIQQGINPDLNIIGSVICRYDGRPNLTKHLKGVIEQQGQAAGIPLLCCIRNGIAVQEAQAFAKSLYEYAPASKPAQDYAELFKIIMEKVKR